MTTSLESHWRQVIRHSRGSPVDRSSVIQRASDSLHDLVMRKSIGCSSQAGSARHSLARADVFGDDDARLARACFRRGRLRSTAQHQDYRRRPAEARFFFSSSVAPSHAISAAARTNPSSTATTRFPDLPSFTTRFS
jgi:hypothetical protein